MVHRYQSELGLGETQYEPRGSTAGMSCDVYSLDKVGTLPDLPISEKR